MSADSAGLDEGLSSDAIDRFLADDDDDESILESASASDTTPSDAPASDPASDSDDDSPAPEPESDAAQASATPVAPAEAAPSEIIPPVEVGQPFTFRVDGTDITPEGALRFADHIRIPLAAWDQEIRPKYLANRNAWRDKEAGYQQELSAARQAKSDREYRAEQLVQRVEGLVNDPDALMEWVANYQQSAPILLAEARAAALEAQLGNRQAEDKARQDAADAEVLRPQLQQHLGAQLEAALTEEPFKILGANKEEAVKFLQQLWTRHAGSLFYEDASGQIGFHGEVLRELVQEKAGQLQAIRDAVDAATKTARDNAKAVAPTPVKAGPRSVPPKVVAKSGAQKRMTKDEFEDRWADLNLSDD